MLFPFGDGATVSEKRPLISIVMPVYNEAKTIREIVRRVRATPYDKEIVVVNDASTDGTGDILRELEGPDLRVLHHERNQGKGAALRTAQSHLQGQITIIQDADLEYDPADYEALLKPLLDGRADVVYGSRFIGGPHRVLLFWHRLGNSLLTFLSNMFTNLDLTDMETGYKALRTEVFQRIRIKSSRFGIEPELTAKVSKMRLRIYETPISYSGRSYEEGKKITWLDGIAAFWHIIRFRFFDWI
jgi:glycosyltransferase involved in cell wall biosynthesis